MTPLVSWRLGRARRRCHLSVEAAALSRPLPDQETPVNALEILVLDFETTGLDPARDRIVMAGWVLIRHARIELGSADELRVHPEAAAGVGQSAVIHGIVDSDLDDATDEAGLLEALMPLLAGRVIAAHAAAIERGFLHHLLRRHGGVRLPHTFVDTLAVERRLLESRGMPAQAQQDALNLATARSRYGLPPHSQHSALSDAVACAELLLAQISVLEGHRVLRLAEIA